MSRQVGPVRPGLGRLPQFVNHEPSWRHAVPATSRLGQNGLVSEGGTAGQGGRETHEERDVRNRRRRADVLALPMTPLCLHGYLDQSGRHPNMPVAVGVGPDDIAVAAWPPPSGEHGLVVTSHDGHGPYLDELYRSRVRPSLSVTKVPTSLKVSFIQPFPAARS